MEEEMLSIGLCRSCKVGPLGLRTCGHCGRIVLLCDECDAAYASYEEEAEATFADEEEMPCPLCGIDLWAEDARWATVEDLNKEPKLLELIENDQVTIEQGKPFSRGSFGDAE